MFLRNLFFSRPSIAERELNLEHDLVIGTPLGFKIYIDNIPQIETDIRDWLQQCVNLTITNLMAWLEHECEFDRFYYSKTGVSFSTTGVAIYLPPNNAPRKTYQRGNTYLTSALSSVATSEFRKAINNRANAFPGTTEQYTDIGQNFIIAARFFNIDEDNQMDDAYNYLLWTLNTQPIPESEENDESNESNESDDESGNVQWMITKPSSTTTELTTFLTRDLKFALVAKYLPIAVPVMTDAQNGWK